MDLNINHPDTPCVLSIINSPSDQKAYSPILRAIIGVIVKQMSQLNRSPSFLVLDEAPTLQLEEISRIPATLLRSYDVSTLYCIQDKSLSDESQGEMTTRAIISNLSSMYIGPCMDPKSAKLYEGFSELIKEEQKSINQSHNPFSSKGETRITLSEKEQTRIRAHDFLRFKAGEFYHFSSLGEKKIKFPYHQPTLIKPEPINDLTQRELRDNYIHILQMCEHY